MSRHATLTVPLFQLSSWLAEHPLQARLLGMALALALAAAAALLSPGAAFASPTVGGGSGGG
jgi:hypothetical protein